MSILETLAAQLGFVRYSTVQKKLQFARSVGKRLDEHRETVEALEETEFFKDNRWHVGHMATLDDYLLRLYHIVYDSYPSDSGDRWQKDTGEYVRPRPKILGSCGLPEYTDLPDRRGKPRRSARG